MIVVVVVVVVVVLVVVVLVVVVLLVVVIVALHRRKRRVRADAPRVDLCCPASRRRCLRWKRRVSSPKPVCPCRGTPHINVSARLHLRMSECTASLACVCQIFLFETPPVWKWFVPDLLMRLARGEVRGQHNLPGMRARKPTGAGDISLCVSPARRRFSVSENWLRCPPRFQRENRASHMVTREVLRVTARPASTTRSTLRVTMCEAVFLLLESRRDVQVRLWCLEFGRWSVRWKRRASCPEYISVSRWTPAH